jgi:hypothetical protein
MTHDLSYVFIELGAAVVGLAALARIANRLGFSAIQQTRGPTRLSSAPKQRILNITGHLRSALGPIANGLGESIGIAKRRCEHDARHRSGLL